MEHEDARREDWRKHIQAAQVTVIVLPILAGIFTATWYMSADMTRMEKDQQFAEKRITSLEEFQNEGDRWTLNMGQEQSRRLTVLEEKYEELPPDRFEKEFDDFRDDVKQELKGIRAADVHFQTYVRDELTALRLLFNHKKYIESDERRTGN